MDIPLSKKRYLLEREDYANYLADKLLAFDN